MVFFSNLGSHSMDILEKVGQEWLSRARRKRLKKTFSKIVRQSHRPFILTPKPLKTQLIILDYGFCDAVYG